MNSRQVMYKDLIDEYGVHMCIRGIAAFIRIRFNSAYTVKEANYIADGQLSTHHYASVADDIHRCIITRIEMSKKLDNP